MIPTCQFQAAEVLLLFLFLLVLEIRLYALQDIATDLKLENDNVAKKLPIPQFPKSLEISTQLLTAEGGFEILLIGERGSGKSSFGNVLLGKKLLPEGEVPCTSIFTKITYGTTVDGYLIKAGNVRQKIEGLESAWSKIDSDPEVFQHLITQYVVNRDSVSNFILTTDIEEVVLFLPLPELKWGGSIVDCPGVNELRHLSSKVVTRCQCASGIVLVESAMKGTLSEFDVALLTNLKKYGIKEVFIAVNFINVWRMIHDTGEERLKASFEHKLRTIFTDLSDTRTGELIHLVSGNLKYLAKRSTPNEKQEVENMKVALNKTFMVSGIKQLIRRFGAGFSNWTADISGFCLTILHSGNKSVPKSQLVDQLKNVLDKMRNQIKESEEQLLSKDLPESLQEQINHIVSQDLNEFTAAITGEDPNVIVTKEEQISRIAIWVRSVENQVTHKMGKFYSELPGDFSMDDEDINDYTRQICDILSNQIQDRMLVITKSEKWKQIINSLLNSTVNDIVPLHLEIITILKELQLSLDPTLFYGPVPVVSSPFSSKDYQSVDSELSFWHIPLLLIAVPVALVFSIPTILGIAIYKVFKVVGAFRPKLPEVRMDLAKQIERAFDPTLSTTLTAASLVAASAGALDFIAPKKHPNMHVYGTACAQALIANLKDSAKNLVTYWKNTLNNAKELYQTLIKEDGLSEQLSDCLVHHSILIQQAKRDVGKIISQLIAAMSGLSPCGFSGSNTKSLFTSLSYSISVDPVALQAEICGILSSENIVSGEFLHQFLPDITRVHAEKAVKSFFAPHAVNRDPAAFVIRAFALLKKSNVLVVAPECDIFFKADGSPPTLYLVFAEDVKNVKMITWDGVDHYDGLHSFEARATWIASLSQLLAEARLLIGGHPTQFNEKLQSIYSQLKFFLIDEESLKFVTPLQGSDLRESGESEELLKANFEGTNVVLKQCKYPMLPTAENEDSSYLFAVETVILCIAQHPNIIRIAGFSFVNNRQTIVLEQAKYSLGNLAKEVKLTPEDFARLALQMVAALDYSHSLGVALIDIKPQNVLIFGSSFLLFKLSDFGSADLMTPETVTPTIKTDMYGFGQALMQAWFGVTSTSEVPQQLIGGSDSVSSKVWCLICRCCSASEEDRPLPHAAVTELIPIIANLSKNVRNIDVKGGVDETSNALGDLLV